MGGENNLKFIVLLREPVSRAYSHYQMIKKRKKENLPFLLAIFFEKFRIKKSIDSKRDFSYLSRGFYSSQLERYFELFDKNNFYIVLYEDFVNNQNKYMNEILQFLGVFKQYNFENKIVFKGKYKPINPLVKYFLKIYYKNEYKKLSQYGLNTQAWENY